MTVAVGGTAWSVHVRSGRNDRRETLNLLERRLTGELRDGEARNAEVGKLALRETVQFGGRVADLALGVEAAGNAHGTIPWMAAASRRCKPFGSFIRHPEYGRTPARSVAPGWHGSPYVLRYVVCAG